MCRPRTGKEFRIENTIFLATMSNALLGVFVDFLVSIFVVSLQHFWFSWQLPRSTSAPVSAVVMLTAGVIRGFVRADSRDIARYSHGESVVSPEPFEGERTQAETSCEEIEFNTLSGPSRAMLAVGAAIVSVPILTSTISQSWSIEPPRYGGALLVVLATWTFLVVRSTNWLPSFSPVWIATPTQLCRISVFRRDDFELSRVAVLRVERTPFRRLGIMIVSILVDQNRCWTGLVDSRRLDDVLRSHRFERIRN
jgi:hypothetical protein